MQDADFLLNTFGIYPEFQNDLETRQTWVSFRLDGDNQTCEVRMVLPRKTDGQQKNECQVEGSIETYTTRYLLRKALGLCDDSDDPDAKPQGGGGGKKQQNKAQASTDAKATDGFSNVR